MADGSARDYFYSVDLRGRLFHDGTELTDGRFLDFFFRRLRDNETGNFEDHPYLSPCAGERNFVRAEDRPIVFLRLAEGKLWFAASLSVPFEPDALRCSKAGRLYHPAPVGGLGLLHSHVVLELRDRVAEGETGYVLEWDGAVFPILVCDS